MLTQDQQAVYGEMEKGRDLLVRGAGGTGKTYLFCEFAERHPDALILTPTGRAASNIQQRGVWAQTIHSFFRVEDNDQLGHHIRQCANDARLMSLTHIIMDEVSMVSCSLFTAVMRFLERKRRGAMPPVFLFGDFHQLPPVWKEGEEARRGMHLTRSAFIGGFKPMRLTRNIRAADDPRLARLLDAVRESQVAADAAVAEINAECRRAVPDDRLLMPFIFSTRREAEAHNAAVMRGLDGIPVELTADRLWGSGYGVDTWKIVPRADKAQGSETVERIPLKDGCKVLCIRNRYEPGEVEDTPSGHTGKGRFAGHRPAFVTPDGTGMFLRCSNGTFGTYRAAGNSFTHRHCTTGETVETEVFAFDDDVRLPPEAEEINREAFVAMRNGVTCIERAACFAARPSGAWRLTRRPCIIPGYGINIHKTQGMTISDAALSIGWNAPGLVYTALSRFTSLDGIRLVRDVPRAISGCDFNDGPLPMQEELCVDGGGCP